MSFQGPGYPGGPQGQPDPYGTPQRPDEYTSYQQPQSYEQYPSYEQPQSYDQPQGYDQYHQYQQPPADPYAQPSGPPAASAPPYPQPWAQPPQKSGMSGGVIAAIVGGGLVVLLLLAVGGVLLLNRGGGEPTTPTGGGSPTATETGGDTGGGNLDLADSSTAEDLFAPKLEPPDHPKYSREQVGETGCETIAAGEEAKNTLEEIGCKKVYLALYVSEDKKYAVTVGYIDVGSESAAKDGSTEKYGEYNEYNSWFKFLIPEDSKITEETKVFTYVSSNENYVTFGTGAYYDGKDAEDGLDDTLMGEAIGVGVGVMFA